MNALVGQKVKLPTDCKCGAGADHGRAEPRLIFCTGRTLDCCWSKTV
jgi:hypothetical protein